MKKVTWMVLVMVMFFSAQAFAAALKLEKVQQEIIEKTAQIAILRDQIETSETQIKSARNTIEQLTGQVFYMRGLVTELKKPEQSLLEKAGIIPPKGKDEKKDEPKPNK